MIDQIIINKNDSKFKLLKSKVNYDRGFSKDLNEINFLIKEFKNLNEINSFCNAVCAYSRRATDLTVLYDFLKEVIFYQQNNIRAWKYWTYCNLSYIDKDIPDIEKYVNNTLKGFDFLIKSKNSSMHYLCQMCSIFFNYATIISDFDQISIYIKSLEPDSIIQILPQLTIQFSHTDLKIRKFVFEILKDFSKNHFQALAFPLYFLSKLNITNEVKDYISVIEMNHIQITNDCHLFSNSFSNLAILPFEELYHLIIKQENLFEFENIDNSILISELIINFIENLEVSLGKFFNQNFYNLYTNLKNCILNKRFISINTILRQIINSLNNQIKTLDLIDLSTINIGINNSKSFLLNIPGHYQIDKPLIYIQEIHNILKVLPSAQKPRKFKLLGNDGINYKFILKGGEDLRLDQHLMQFFSLINSILDEDKFGKDLHIRIHISSVIPLSNKSGLIQWAQNSKTLHSLIKWYRKIKNIPLDPELNIYENNYLNQESSIFLNNIQKLELYKDLCNVSNENQMRESIWLLSKGSEIWVTQNTNFSRSHSLMCIVGHIIGLGDRHPSNLLYMKKNGNIIHVDLSDCFEKASKRKILAEKIPFRLTRMILSTLGQSKFHGIFYSTSEYILNLLKRNQSTLLAFLDIFVREPVINPEWYINDIDNNVKDIRKALMKQAISIISNKLNLKYFDSLKINTVENYLNNLIETAIDEYNLSNMYYGWLPNW